MITSHPPEQVFSSGGTLPKISFEICVCHGLNSSLPALPTPFFWHPRPSVSLSNLLWRAGPSFFRLPSWREDQVKSDLSCSSRAGDHRLMCGRGVLRSLGRMEETAKESGISDPAYHQSHLLPRHSLHPHPQFSSVLDPSEREAGRNWNVRR